MGSMDLGVVSLGKLEYVSLTSRDWLCIIISSHMLGGKVLALG
jgi:hypothetical protein